MSKNFLNTTCSEGCSKQKYKNRTHSLTHAQASNTHAHSYTHPHTHTLIHIRTHTHVCVRAYNFQSHERSVASGQCALKALSQLLSHPLSPFSHTLSLSLTLSHRRRRSSHPKSDSVESQSLRQKAVSCAKENTPAYCQGKRASLLSLECNILRNPSSLLNYVRILSFNLSLVTRFKESNTFY